MQPFGIWQVHSPILTPSGSFYKRLGLILTEAWQAQLAAP